MDHSPFDGAEHMIADICAALGMPDVPLQSPAAPASRYKRRYGVAYCLTCDLDARYCKCAFQPAATAAADGAGSDLARRIRDCQGGR